MKILYFGTVCDLQNYENMMSHSKEKASVATIVFESSLLSGLKQNGVEADVYSFPMIPAFPKTKYLFWGNKKENLNCGYSCTWLKTFNVPVIKQLSRRLNGRRLLKKWLKANKGQDCAVLSYSMPPFLTKDIVKLSRKYGVKCMAIVTDLLRDMYINSKNSGFVMFLKNRYLSQALKWQGAFDGYVYLTDAMKDVINPEKPYTVMEGIADISAVNTAERAEKARPAAIMYAGMVEEKFGIINLLDAFEAASLGDTELWIFGVGNGVEKVKARADANPKIRYFGHKKREEILEYEKKASLLVNPRNGDDEYTKYSFPSKTIEYMLSATPVLTTKLKGIPDEYYDYLFSCDDNSVLSLQQALEQAMSTSEEERAAMGIRARRFIAEEKNAAKQAERIVGFAMEVIKR